MKISKQTNKKSTVKASDTPAITQQNQFADVTQVVDNCPYASAKCYIKSAISELSKIASSDVVAKDSIANLAVVLLDLEGSTMTE